MLKTVKGYTMTAEDEQRLLSLYERHPLIDIHDMTFSYIMVRNMINENSETYTLLNSKAVFRITEHENVYKSAKEKYGNDIQKWKKLLSMLEEYTFSIDSVAIVRRVNDLDTGLLND